MTETASNQSTEGREIVMTRLFDAPRELVWEVWTSPKHVAHWWGPRGYTITTEEMNVRVGGTWRFMMLGPDGTNYPNLMTFHEVKAPEKLVYDHGSYEQPKQFHVTSTFTSEGTKTRIRHHLIFPTKEACEAVKAFGAVELGQQSLDCFADYIATIGGFSISRTFNAPLDLVWRAWTEEERLAKWWGPKGLTMVKAKLDLRPGGLFHYGMKAPPGAPMGEGTMWGKFLFREITPQRRIIWVNSFADEAGNTVRHPMAPTWPLEMLNHVTFSEENRKTTVTLRGGPINATAEEMKVYNDNHPSLNAGFSGTLDQLDEYLRTS